MKVLLISKAMTVQSTLSKAELLSKQVDLTLVTPSKWPNYTEEKELIPKNYRHFKLKVWMPGKNHFHFYSGIEKIISEVSPDIIHIDEEPYSLVTILINRIAKQKEIKSICFTWQNIYKKYPFPFSFIEQYNYRKSDCIIAGNLQAKNILIKKGYTGKISLIPQFGVDTSVFYPKEGIRSKFNISSLAFVVGYVGRLIEEKGIRTLIDSMQGLQPYIKLYLAGTGDLRQELEKIVLQKGLKDRVHFLGGFSSVEISEFISCCDCIVLPSLTKPNWKEQFGRILVEAMASGVPVSGSDSGEIPNVIADCGVIFKENDVQECRQSIIKLQSPDFRKNCIEKGLKRVHDNYTQEKIVDATTDVYRMLLRC